MPAIKDNAICIRLLDWSETSQIVVLMTEQHGKISATARGAKRRHPSAQAKFSGGVELLTGGEAVLIVKRTSDLANLTEWDMRSPHWHLRRDIRAYRLSMYGADLVHHIVQDHDAHERTYRALEAFLAGLIDRANHARALLRFQWEVIDDMGLRPVLDRDAQTGGALDEKSQTLAFSAEAGGLVADIGSNDRWRMRRETVELLRSLTPGSESPDIAIATGDEAMGRANRLLCSYLRTALDKELPTMGVVFEEAG